MCSVNGIIQYTTLRWPFHSTRCSKELSRFIQIRHTNNWFFFVAEYDDILYKDFFFMECFCSILGKCWLLLVLEPRNTIIKRYFDFKNSCFIFGETWERQLQRQWRLMQPKGCLGRAPTWFICVKKRGGLQEVPSHLVKCFLKSVIRRGFCYTHTVWDLQ